MPDRDGGFGDIQATDPGYVRFKLDRVQGLRRVAASGARGPQQHPENVSPGSHRGLSASHLAGDLGRGFASESPLSKDAVFRVSPGSRSRSHFLALTGSRERAP
jgi:hypothetical protein